MMQIQPSAAALALHAAQKALVEASLRVGEDKTELHAIYPNRGSGK